MAEVMVINPRRRRGRKRTTRARSKRTTRRRRRRVALANPIRRRRRRGVRRRASSRRRAHRNPRLGSFMGVNITTAGGAALGIIGANLATAAVLNNIPGIPANFKSGPAKIAAKVIIGIGAGLLVKKVLKQGNLGNGIMAGGIIAALLDAYTLYVVPSLPASLQDYELEGGVGVYELGDGDGGDFNDTGVTGMGENQYTSMY